MQMETLPPIPVCMLTARPDTQSSTKSQLVGPQQGCANLEGTQNASPLPHVLHLHISCNICSPLPILVQMLFVQCKEYLR